MMSEASAKALMGWVERGGKLVSEGCPAYFSGRGHAGTVQPNLGWDRVFGAREEYVEFTPDLLEKLMFRSGDLKDVSGGINMQTYRLSGGTASGWFSDGRIAVVDHQYGKGRTRLVGTHPGAGYLKFKSPASREFFASILKWAGKEPNIRRTGDLTVRLHDGPGGTYLWIVNNKAKAEELDITLASKWGVVRNTEILWGEQPLEVRGNGIHAVVGPLDAVVARLVK